MPQVPSPAPAKKQKVDYKPVVPVQQLGFIHNNMDCIGCRACEIACKDKNGLPPGPRFRRVQYIEGGTFPSVFAYKVNMSCNHCTSPLVCRPARPERFGSVKKTVSSISIRHFASAVGVAKLRVRTARRNLILKRVSSRSATCVLTRLMPVANRTAWRRA